MHRHPDALDVVATLRAQGEPFVLATVVRTVSVTAAKAGAKAVIRPDGSITEGWIGGGCARAAVLKAARESIVLLKNDGTLPLKAESVKTIAVVGPLRRAQRGSF